MTKPKIRIENRRRTSGKVEFREFSRRFFGELKHFLSHFFSLMCFTYLFSFDVQSLCKFRFWFSVQSSCFNFLIMVMHLIDLLWTLFSVDETQNLVKIPLSLEVHFFLGAGVDRFQVHWSTTTLTTTITEGRGRMSDDIHSGCRWKT